MNIRILITTASVGLCALTVAGVAVQSKQLGELRAEHQRIMQERESSAAEAPAPAVAPAADSGSTSHELLRLRNEVNRLTSRRKELEGVASENERLRTQVAASKTNRVAANLNLEGFIRKSTARNVGYATPEDTMQTMLWAVQNKDVAGMAQAFTPEMADEFQKEIAKIQAEGRDFFEHAKELPGFRVVERQQLPDGVIVLKVEIAPGSGTEDVRFQLINGQWKMASH
jgi:hypothetical protein